MHNSLDLLIGYQAAAKKMQRHYEATIKRPQSGNYKDDNICKTGQTCHKGITKMLGRRREDAAKTPRRRREDAAKMPRRRRGDAGKMSRRIQYF